MTGVVLEGVELFNRSLVAWELRAEAAARAATSEGIRLIERKAQAKLDQKSHAAGTPTPSRPGEPPARISGTLRDSFLRRGPVVVGFGSYRAEVGPTAVYARVQELGGSAGHAMLPARPYLKPALDESRAELREIYVVAWSRAGRL